MNEVEQNDLLEEAKRKLEEAAREFFEGDTVRAADLAYTAYVQAGKVQDANPTREGSNTLVSRLNYIAGAMLDYFDTTAAEGSREEWDALTYIRDES